MRDTVWRSIWDGETLKRYYRTLNRRYQRLDMVVNWLLAAAGVGTVAVAVSPAPPLTLILVASSVTTLTIWGMLGQFSRKAAIAHAIADRCGEITTDLWQLFRDMNRGWEDEAGAEQTYSRVRARLDAASSKSGEANLPDNERLYKRLEAEVATSMEEQ